MFTLGIDRTTGAFEQDSFQGEEEVIVSANTSQIGATACRCNGPVSRQLVTLLMSFPRQKQEYITYDALR